MKSLKYFRTCLILLWALMGLSYPGGEAGNPVKAQSGNFQVSNYATDFTTRGYNWRGYVFRPSREVTVTHLWGGTSTICHEGFMAALFEVSWTGDPGASSYILTNKLGSVTFVPEDITGPPVQEQQLSQLVTLSPDSYYMIAQGAVQVTDTENAFCHYSSNSIDVDNLLLGSPIIQEWYPGTDFAYYPSGTGTGDHLLNWAISHNSITQFRVLLGFSYVTQVDPAVVQTMGVDFDVDASSATLEGLLVSSGASQAGDLTALYLEHGTHPALAQAEMVPAVPDQVAGPQTDIPFELEVTDLPGGITYYYRAVAINEAGRSEGAILSFPTSYYPPIVRTNQPEEVTGTSAILGGQVMDDNGWDVTERGIWYGTDADPVGVGEQVPMGEGMGSFGEVISGLEMGTTYRVRAYATNEAGTDFGTVRTFTTLDLPTVVTADAVDITPHSAFLGGEVSDDGGADITQRGVYYGTDPDPVVNGTQEAMGTGTGTFSALVENLDPNIQYHFVAYAENSEGISYGDVLSFDTPAAPATVVTLPAGDVTPYSAVLGGEVSDDGGATISDRGIYYGMDPDPVVNGEQLPMGTGTGVFSALVENLDPNVQYHFVAYAVNDAGISYGDVLSFDTPAAPPTVVTLPAQDVTPHSAVLGGEVTDDGGADITQRGVYYGTDPDPVSTGEQLEIGSGMGSFDEMVEGLLPSTQYHFVAFAVNIADTSFGEVISFVTPAAPPTVVTLAAEDITSYSAVLGGEVTDDGGADITQRGVYFGTDPDPVVNGTQAAMGSGTGVFSALVENLDPNVQYHFVAYALNDAGISYGDVLSFDTPAAPPTVVTLPAEDVTSSLARLHGEVLAGGGLEVDERGFWLGTMPEPAGVGLQVPVGAGLGGFSSVVEDLHPNTQYYFTAYAANDVGESLGETFGFVTDAEPPIVITGEAEDVTSLVASLSGEVLYDGGANVFSRGVLWGEGPNPQATGVELEAGSGLGPFWIYLDGLSPETTYFAVAFAENQVDRTFGEVISFTTKPFLEKIPNAFIPSSHIESNRTFRPLFHDEPQHYRLRIYNRWGSIVFDADDPFLGWDGRIDGRDAPPGGYFYELQYRDFAGGDHSHRGQVILVR